MGVDDLSEDFSLKQAVQRFGKFAWMLALFAIAPLIMLYVFGFSAKTTEEYTCALRMAEQNPEVALRIGEPITPGLFAWTSYFESGGGLRQGRFSTGISGPRGKGTLIVEFYRTPVGSSLGVWLKTGREEFEVYYGSYPCR